MKFKTKQTQQKHILKIYNLCTDIEKSSGLNWYKEANQYGAYLSELFKLDSNIKVCGIISALSPACSWERNKVDANNFLALACIGTESQILSGKFGTYKNNVLKAIEIYNLEKPTSKKIASILLGKTGLKTMNFFFNISDLKNTNAVTIDRHAAKVANNHYKGGSVSITKRQYIDCSNSYISVANKLKIAPYQLQAVVWEKYRNLRTLKN